MNAEGSSRTVYKIGCESPALGGRASARVSPPGALGENRHVGGLRGLGRLFAALVMGFLVVLSGSCTGTSERFRYGADRLFDEPYWSWVRGKRVGLITNQTGVTNDLAPLYRKLQAHPEVRLTALFAPEHGLFGEQQAGVEIRDGAMVYSLYGEHRKPTPAMLQNVDVLVYDIQDVGARFYTYISTLGLAMEAAAEANLPFLVLDRPNPLGGVAVEGPVLEDPFRSFVGAYRIPIRYGLTPAELAHWIKKERRLDLVLWYVPLAGWHRQYLFEELEQEWIPPSPNIPTPRSALVYAGTCLLEGTNLSEGRGTTRPFELFGAPWLNDEVLVTLLNEAALPGVIFRRQPFQPTFSKYAGIQCRGIQIHVTDPDTFQPVLTALAILREVLNLHPEEFEFSAETFDRLVGNSWVRRMLVESRAVRAIRERWQQDLKRYAEQREEFLLY
ncbi:MAG TPA: DUF1343 domain-containing protein [Acidobacteriota bacterium]|nr:DUF1343 domain-containing protein [Acidobacteriota bacterium]